MDIEGILAIVLIFGGGAMFLLAISPVGKAIADRIRGTGAGALPEGLRQELEESRAELLNEVQQLRTEVGELSERMDFAERLLAKNREDQRIGPARS
jgi:hypothetical protein